MKYLLTSAAFANAGAVAATSAPRAGAPKAEDRIAPAFTAVRTDVKPPVGVKRGQKSELAIALEALEVNASIGITNKTKKQISSTISKVNNADTNQTQKKNPDGSFAFTPGAEIKDAAGAVIGHGQPVAVMEKLKEFQAFDVDPKKDPDKATVRIFRIK